MLKKMLTGGLAAGAIAVPLASVAWADPPGNPAPSPVPGTNASEQPAAPAANGQGPAVPAANGQNPTCVASANAPATNQTTNQTAQGNQWQQVATLQGSVASQLGLPAGQVIKVYCAPAGTPNPQSQPAGAENPQMPPGQQPAGAPGQNPQTEPAGVQNPGQVPPQQQ